jgi:hypothetical protein
MATNREEIIEDFYAHMRKTGGAASDWLVGMANDSRGRFSETTSWPMWTTG